MTQASIKNGWHEYPAHRRGDGRILLSAELFRDGRPVRGADGLPTIVDQVGLDEETVRRELQKAMADKGGAI